MKRRTLGIIALVLALLMFGACTARNTAQSRAEVSWADANIDDARSYADIVARAREEGRVVWYSNSSRSRNVAEGFMARYPGIQVEVFDISTNELIERFSREYDAGIRNADLLHLADGDGTMYMEFVQMGMIHIYRPQDIVPHINPTFLGTAMPMFIEFDAWFYNTDYFDTQPITSWWDLTKPEWKGRLLMRPPMDHVGTLALLSMMLKNADQMAADYQRVFGTPLVLSARAPTAAHEFMIRLMANDPVIITSSGEIIRSVGLATTTPVLGLGSSGGLRRQEEEGLPIAIATGLTPATGIPGISGLYITNEANNPNAAMLLVRYMTDSHGEGFEPFGTLGGWPPRGDIPIHPGNPPLDSINFWPNDSDFVYNNALQIADFLMMLN